MSARQTLRRVKRVIELQWRGGCIVLVIIAEVVFFSVIFVSMDNSTQVNAELLEKATPWLTCLALKQGDKNGCLSLASGLVKSEPVVLAVLIVLGVRYLPLNRPMRLTGIIAQWVLVPDIFGPVVYDTRLDGIVQDKVPTQE